MLDINEIVEKIEVEKQILSTMPRNNEKNNEKYVEKICYLKKDYENMAGEIEKILNSRYKKLVNVKSDKNIENLDIRIKTIESTLYLLSYEKMAYEKMELDKIIYKISRFYKDNLENINLQIESAVEQFYKVGIKLELSDFEYSDFVKQYMKVFFDEKRKGNINSIRVKEKFEEIYWKCPDLIVHIELNLRNIFIKNQSKIEKKFEKEKNELLKQWEKLPSEITDLYLEMIKQREEIIFKDKKELLEKFLSGKLNANDYDEDKVQSYYAQILSPIKLNSPETNQDETEKEILGLLDSLYEYKNYLNFKFIIDDVKKYFVEKEQYKKIYDETLKNILLKEKKLKKINSKKGFFRKKEVKQIAEQNQIIEELKKEYRELDKNRFLNKIYIMLNENSTLQDVLLLAISDYSYLANCIIENNKTITQEKIDEQILKLSEFLKNPNNNIIKNITIMDEKDIAIVIKDRYKLLNFNIKQESLVSKNMDNLILLLEKLATSFRIKKSGLKVQELQEIINIKNTLKI